MKSDTLVSGFVVGAAVVAWLLSALPIGAADIVVNTNEDTRDGWCTTLPIPPDNCSLRLALILANTTAGKDTIHLQAGAYYIEIEGADDDLALTGDFDVLEDVDIVGLGSTSTFVKGDFLDRVFHVFDPPGPMPAPVLQLFDLLVGGGNPLNDPINPTGGGVLVDEGAGLHLWRCVVSGNVSVIGAGVVAAAGTTVLVVDTTFDSNQTIDHMGNSAGSGGAITTFGGTLLIVRSTFHDNQATFGSAVRCGNYGTVNMVNTTIANNSGTDDQGAVHINSCNTVIDSTTFAGNSPHGARGQNLANYPWVVRNTYFGDSCSFVGTLCPVSEGGNVDAGMSCCISHPSDFENRPNLVGPLGDHGGYTQTMLPVAPFWPVVDNPGANSHCQSEDQRGVSRPQDFSGEPAPIACDTGAVELRDQDAPIFVDGFESGDTSAWSVAQR